MIRLCRVVRASADTEVTGVTGATSVAGIGELSYEQAPVLILSKSGMFDLERGFNILLRTLSELKGNKPLAAYAAVMFFLVTPSLLQSYTEM